jgi:DNA-binding MarR family transcriptional regulator
VAQPNATKICDRLSDKGLARRSRSRVDRRSVRVSVTAQGREVVAQVSAARRAELARIVRNMDRHGQEAAVAALRSFTLAGGGIPEDGWALGWGQ